MRGMTEPEVFVLADRAMEEAGREKFDGDLLGDDPKRSFAAIVAGAWIGVAPDLPEELVEGIWAQISPHAEQWREIGVFPPAVAVAPDAPLLDRLLGLTGRDPAA